MLTCLPFVVSRIAAVSVALAGLARASGDVVRLSVTRDTWVSAADGERDKNCGGSTRLKTKGTQELTLVDIDPAPLKGRVVLSATLSLHSASEDAQRRVTVSTIASDWVEGTASSYERQAGAASFDWAAQDERPWAFPGSDITAVINGSGNTLWRFADATRRDEREWQSIAIDPDVIAARVAGISSGFAVMDDVGSEYERDGDRFTYRMFLNRFAHSREEGERRAPYVTVELGEYDRDAPERIDRIATDVRELAAGEALVSWTSPADRGPAGTIGFLARYAPGEEFYWRDATPVPQYLVPMARRRGDTLVMHLCDLALAPGTEITLGIASVDRAGNVSEPSIARVTLAGAPKELALAPIPSEPSTSVGETSAAATSPGEAPTVGGLAVSVIDALDKIHPVSGVLIPAHDESYLALNHLWSAHDKKISLQGARNEFVEFQVALSGQASDIEVRASFDDPSIAVALFRARRVATSLGPLPDPLVPHTGTFGIPSMDEAITDERHAAVHVELYLPHELKSGLHSGALSIRVGAESIAIPIELRVWTFVLPDRLSFLAEMNAYSLPDSPADLAYYRLAHRHRTCLNRLGYNWRGEVNVGCGPKWNGEDFEWKEYDAHYGPLLDGSAFSDLPRAGVPVDAFYLPLNENWPLPIEPAFRGGYWADEALDPSYLASFADAAGKFAAHASAKGWNETLFEFYLNNKVYFKESSWARSSAPWVFDEPMNTQDFWALRTYGLAFHRGVAERAGKAQLVYRCDVSRPEWQRDLLDDVSDVLVVGSAFRRYKRGVTDRKRSNGELVIEYSTTNAVEESNVMPVAWCLDAWCRGADGVVPWQTIGTDNSWTQGDALSLFYPGAPVKSSEPVASARLKAFRRGEQDVEYLTMLAVTLGVPRFVIADAVAKLVELDPRATKTSADDAACETTTWILRSSGRPRARVGAMLDELHLPAKEKWVDRSPKRPRDPLPPAYFHAR